jgi:6-pyruvoyltetrahydropterin/6-carboxytetrahydropterin synthase
MRLEIDGRYSNIKFSACHFIAGHARCGKLHGHLYVIQVILHGEKGEDGMIMDFIELKRVLRMIADEFDHRVLLPGRSERVILEHHDDEVEAKIDNKRYIFPMEDVLILDIKESSAEEIAEVMVKRIVEEIDITPNIKGVEVGVDEERGQSAWVSRDLS